METPMAPAMSCKTSKNNQHGTTRGESNEIKSKLACILEASKSTRLRVGESSLYHHEDHIAAKGDSSLQHENLVHTFIPMPRAMKIPATTAAVDKEWEKLKNFGVGLDKVRSGKEVIDEARTKGANFHFASLMDICHLKNAELDAYSLNKGHQHHKWQQQTSLISYPAARVRRTSSWCSENSKIGMSRHLLDSSSTTQMVKNHGPKWKTKSFFLSEICTVILWQDSYGISNLRAILLRLGEGLQLGMLIRTPWKQNVLIWVRGWQQIGWKETKHWSDVESTQERSWFGRPTSFLDHVHLECAQRQSEISKDIVVNYRTMIESRISAGGAEQLPCSEMFRISSWSYDMEGHAKKCMERDIASWQTRRLYNSTKYQHHASMTIISKKKNWNLLEIWQK